MGRVMDLRKIAEAATPGPCDACGHAYHEHHTGAGWCGECRCRKYDSFARRYFTSAWSPDRALAALDVIEAASDLLTPGRAVVPSAVSKRLRAALDRWEALG